MDIEGVYRAGAKNIQKIIVPSSVTSEILGKETQDMEFFAIKTGEDYHIRTANGILELKKGIYLIPVDYNVIRSRATEYESNKLQIRLQRYDSSAGNRNNVIYLD